MKSLKDKILTSVDEGYNVMVYLTPDEIKRKLLNLDTYYSRSGEELSTEQILKSLDETGFVYLYTKDDYDFLSDDWVYRVETHK
jgi:hypothetical protein